MCTGIIIFYTIKYLTATISLQALFEGGLWTVVMTVCGGSLIVLGERNRIAIHHTISFYHRDARRTTHIHSIYIHRTNERKF